MNGLTEKLNAFYEKEWIRKAANILFYLGLSIEILVLLIDKSALYNPVEGRIFQVTFCIFFLKLVLTKYDRKEWIAIFAGLLFGLFVDRLSDRNEIIRFAVFIAACKDMDLRKVLKYMFFTTLGGSLLIVLLSFTGLFGELRVIKEYPGGVVKNLYAFGMGNANAFHCMFFALTLLYLYLYEKSVKWWGYVLLLAADVILAVLTRSKTGAAITAFSVLIMAGLHYVLLSKETGSGERPEKLLRAGSIVCFFLNGIGLLISFWFAGSAWKLRAARWKLSGYESAQGLIGKVDSLLTGRISLLTVSDKWEGAVQSWRWLPEKGHEAYFDLGFVRLFYWYGIFAALVILAVFALFMLWLFRKEKYNEIIFLTLMSLYTVVEAHFVSVYMARNYALVLLGCMLPEMMKCFAGSDKK